ncbi:GPI inositol-deacylase [Photobacterium japonica]|uniref:PGAP1-like alpha/beta domain-containing protein n=1 Tax=Photobacterium japonica TaxID=2910235 RepID=UPI003D1347AB
MKAKYIWRQQLNTIRQGVSLKLQTNSEHAKQRARAFLEQGIPPRQSQAFLALLNGLMGDHLLRRKSRLALPMVLTDQQQVLADNSAPLATQLPHATGRIVLCVHGWCMADKGWLRKGHDHGQQFVAMGYTPLYLRYNTGKHISLNGEEFAFRLEKLLIAWPCPVKELVIIGHSMGGLVSRSACYYADQHQLNWLQHLTTFITLGTPHNGAPLARFACWIDEYVAGIPQLSLLRKIGDMRSSGTKDLSRGYIVHHAWEQKSSLKTGLKAGDRTGTPLKSRPLLPANTHCYAVATCLSKHTHDDKHRKVGDGLVPVDSALGAATKNVQALNYPKHHQWLVGGVNHVDLLSHPQVRNQLMQWVLANAPA